MLSSAKKVGSLYRSINVILMSVFSKKNRAWYFQCQAEGFAFHQQILGSGKRSDSMLIYQNHK